MKIQETETSVIIDCSEDQMVDLGVFMALREMYGERALQQERRMSIDLSSLRPAQIRREQDTIRFLLNNR